MKKFAYTLFFLVCFRPAFTQTLTDSGMYLIHKFEQRIGKETYTATASGKNLLYHVDFKYIDRGSPVGLTASITLTPAFEPLAFRIKGGTSRFSTVNDSVVINNKMAAIKVDDSLFSKPVRPNSFAIAGYAPATTQRLLLHYWNLHNHPATIPMLPFGAVQIRKDGMDTVSLNQKAVLVERYVITGLVWGNELLWTTTSGQLVCLITNDAEGDKQEIILQPYESLLPTFIDKAAIYGMRLFTRTANASTAKHPVIAIKNARLVNIATGTTTPDATVLIKNGIITYAGAALGAVPADAYVIDAKGKTLLPGLWDMHAHFEQAEWGPAYLAAGVTTVRDCGNEFGYINAIKSAIDESRGIGPHILKAGLIDGKGFFALGIIQADTKEEAIAAVDRYKENGFAQIKIYSSVKPAIVKAICDEAHRLQLTVTGHIPEGMTLMQAVDSGMDMVNHVQYVASVLKRGKEKYTYDFTDSASIAVFRFIKEHHVVIDPTLGVYELGFRSLKDSITDIEPAFATLPQPMKPLFTNTGSSDSAQVKRGKAIMKAFEQIVNALYQDSITIVAGTDMGFPGYSVFRELELYVQSGLTPLQALQSATVVPARVMHLDTVTGSVDVGKKADLILVDGDPVHDIHQIRNVTLVLKDGNIYDPAALHQMAGFQ